MTAGNDPFDPETLEVGGRYRVDHRHERLRRTFRTEGTYLGTGDGKAEDGTPVRVLRLEVKPRFGRSSVQNVDPGAVVDVQSLDEESD